MTKKICVVTGSRAEFGLLQPLLHQIKKDKTFKLQLLVTGAHLSKKYGYTCREIEQSGYAIAKKVNLDLVNDTAVGICDSMGKAVSRLAHAFNELKPDLVVLLGDRFEILAAAIAAHVSHIRIAHIHGGESTEGAMDDAFRHAITKMSLLHFTATEQYRKTVIQLGESPHRVFNAGSLGVENIATSPLMGKNALEKELGFCFAQRNIMITFHPVTMENQTSAGQFKELLAAIDGLDDVRVIFTKPNADTGNHAIRKLIDDYVKQHGNRAVCFESMGALKYLSTLQFVDVVAGNSSSGIIEVPSFGKPTVNIGDRQKGRVRAKSVIDAGPHKKAIRAAIDKALSPGFLAFCRTVKNPYYRKNTAENIYRIIKKNMGQPFSIKKTFYRIGEL